MTSHWCKHSSMKLNCVQNSWWYWLRWWRDKHNGTSISFSCNQNQNLTRGWSEKTAEVIFKWLKQFKCFGQSDCVIWNVFICWFKNDLSWFSDFFFIFENLYKIHFNFKKYEKNHKIISHYFTLCWFLRILFLFEYFSFIFFILHAF